MPALEDDRAGRGGVVAVIFLIEIVALVDDRTLQRDAGELPRLQVQRAFDLLFSRRPDPGELRDAVELVDGHGLAALCRALFNSNEFLFVE